MDLLQVGYYFLKKGMDKTEYDIQCPIIAYEK